MVLLEIWRVSQIDPLPQEKLLSKSPASLGLKFGTGKFHFSKFKKNVLLRKYEKAFNLGARKFHFLRYKTFFWREGEGRAGVGNIRNVLRVDFFIFFFFELELKSGSYSSICSNRPKDLWHAGCHHSLVVPWGFTIHKCIDGFSTSWILAVCHRQQDRGTAKCLWKCNIACRCLV